MNTITRRQFMGLGACALALAGCASRAEAPAEEAQQETAPAEGAAPAETAAPAESAAPAETAAGANALVLVYSRADENYRVGYIETGNTMVLAQMIAEKTGADLFELEPAVPYPESYDACIDQALAERNENARPELKALPDLSGYDQVFLGFPCWWGDLPMPVYTALEALSWEGKTISPFNTHEGSGESGMFSSVASTCAGSTVTEGLTVRGEVAQNSRDEARAEVETWLSGLGF